MAKGLPKADTLKPISIRFKLYTDDILKCYGTTSFIVVDYETNKFEEFTKFAMETENEIILCHLVSGKLGLPKVLCHHKAKSDLDLLEHFSLTDWPPSQRSSTTYCTAIPVCPYQYVRSLHDL